MAVSEGEVKAAEAVAAAPLKADLNSLPIRSYLDQTVVPLLLQGMAQLVCVQVGAAVARGRQRAAPNPLRLLLFTRTPTPLFSPPAARRAARSAPPTP